MGEVIEVNFEAARRMRAQQAAQQHNNLLRMNDTQAHMLKLLDAKLSEPELIELYAALEDVDCYTQSCEHLQLLVDIYHLMGVN